MLSTEALEWKDSLTSSCPTPVTKHLSAPVVPKVMRHLKRGERGTPTVSVGLDVLQLWKPSLGVQLKYCWREMSDKESPAQGWVGYPSNFNGTHAGSGGRSNYDL
ncbi:hypothetical protein EYF80_065718 [Liparis tanakae]|uniref:Uncharacterized protein n=1 Tax=Liparis tanakae TaxID=230148 RepID=A0A4Z2E5X5_9TELE|nr:hypothetical protein EYF80_065718 [Liparis tanakae]